MKSIRILFTSLTSVLLLSLVSCKKDNPNIEKPDLISKVIDLSFKRNEGFSSTMDLTYDNQNRLKTYNKKEVLYNKDGKVERIRNINPENSLGDEYVYHWDNLGRIISINLEAKKETFNIAKFEYQGNFKKPAKIVWRKIDFIKSNNSSTIYFTNYQEKEFSYQGNNISKIKYHGYEYSYPDNKENDFYAIMYYKYTDKPHFLINLYNQLGYNFLDISDVVSDNQAEMQSTFQSNKPIEDKGPNWETAHKFSIVEDDKLRPITIFINLYPEEIWIPNNNYYLFSKRYSIEY